MRAIFYLSFIGYDIKPFLGHRRTKVKLTVHGQCEAQTYLQVKTKLKTAFLTYDSDARCQATIEAIQGTDSSYGCWYLFHSLIPEGKTNV